VQELRTDELTGAQVIVAPGRATRPEVFRPPATGAQATKPPDSCPFCAGHEAMTPPEVARRGAGDPDTPGWQVRVVPNLYPIVGDGVSGAHEVIVISPAHDGRIDQIPLDAATAAIEMLRDRTAHHLASGLVHAQPILNHGRASGASIEHPHAQLIALGFTPPFVDSVLDRFAAAGGDLVADAIDAARAKDLVVRDDAAVTWCPPASSSPFLTRIALPYGRQRFDRATDSEITALTIALRDALGRLDAVIGDFAYNIVIHTAPRDDDRPFHWWADIVPRVATYGGFEIGTGLWVNIRAPESAASLLRELGA
jgi:UDPglucose--hexose-1-phosphate uridylyltransferase